MWVDVCFVLHREALIALWGGMLCVCKMELVRPDTVSLCVVSGNRFCQTCFEVFSLSCIQDSYHTLKLSLFWYEGLQKVLFSAGGGAETSV